MDESKIFLALSEALTGIKGLGSPAPKSLAATMASDYQHRLKEQFGADFVALLALFDSLAPAADRLAALLAHANFKDKIESVAKQVVNVWMLSQYRVETPEKKGDAAPAFDAGFYEKGLIWPAIGAHAIGFSHGGHGYWATKPTGAVI